MLIQARYFLRINAMKRRARQEEGREKRFPRSKDHWMNIVQQLQRKVAVVSPPKT